MYNHRIKKSTDDNMLKFITKDKLVDEVADNSKKMKIKRHSMPDPSHFKDSIKVERLVKTSLPTTSSMSNRKRVAFASLID